LTGDPQDFRAKIDTGVKILQAFMAEQMKALGFRRITFNVAFAVAGVVLSSRERALPLR
jgi:hypothetical protein